MFKPRLGTRILAQLCAGCTLFAGLSLSAAAQDKPGDDKKPVPTKPDIEKQLKYRGGTTIDNLLAAYQGESNASNRYTEFAKKADEEGYGKAASLFRAAARAEAIHAAAHARVIEKMGGKPAVELAKVEPKSTRENLEAALKGENEERLEMYPEFIVKARADRNTDAMKSFNYARTAETEHARLYQLALDNLDQWKGGKSAFYVCAVCGYTVEKLDFEKCVSCFSAKEKYEKVE